MQGAVIACIYEWFDFLIKYNIYIINPYETRSVFAFAQFKNNFNLRRNYEKNSIQKMILNILDKEQITKKKLAERLGVSPHK